jgi:hypothetical protein
MEEEEEEQVITNITKLDEDLYKYYKLKQRYEKSIDKIKDNIRENYPYLSNSAKRKKMKKAIKCIKCKKSGGTIFTNDNNILKAVCGNSEDPCDLDIEIKKGVYKNIRVMEEKYSKNIESLQNMIIKMKLNLLFGYSFANVSKDVLADGNADLMAETLKEFTKYRDILSERTTKYNKIQKTFLNIVNDTANKDIIEDKEIQLSILIDSLKQMNKEYLLKIDVLLVEEKNKFIDDIIDIYLNQIVPLNEEIVNLKYKVNEVYLDEDKAIDKKDYLLTRERYSIKEMTFLEPF